MPRQWERIRADIIIPEVTNRMFARDNEKFKAACDKAGVEPTGRQASKYRNKKGRAYKAK